MEPMQCSSSSSPPSSESIKKNNNEDEEPINVIQIKIPKNNDFDQETARNLLEKCSTLIVQKFPIGSEFGIDLSIHYTGENFLGLKMIPPGLHFIHFSFVNTKTNSIAPRIGFFYYFLSGEIFITRWDSKEEDLNLNCNDNDNDDNVDRLKENFLKGHLDNHLGAYQFDQYETWIQLTDYITRSLFQRLNPKCKKIYSASNLIYKPNNEDGSSSTGNNRCNLDKQGLPDMILSPESEIRFQTKFPTKKNHFLFPPGSTPEEITRNSLDSTYTLKFLIENYHQGNEFDLLGELQFSFLSFLLGHQYESFEFWLNLLKIICSVQSGLKNLNKFYLAFIRVLYFQLKQTNDAIFADIVENDNQVYKFLRNFFQNLNQKKQEISEELFLRGKNFQNFLEKNLNWKFSNKIQSNSNEANEDDEDEEEDIPDDEKPVIVELDDAEDMVEDNN